MSKVSHSMSKKTICLVDPYSTGGLLAVEAHSRNIQVVALWTTECGEGRWHIPPAAQRVEDLYIAEIEAEENATLNSLALMLGEHDVSDVLCGGETGVKLADALSEHMGLRTNGTANGMENRRDKYFQQEAVRAAGLRAVREAVGKEWHEVEAFCHTEPMPIVVKPVESAGAEGVKICRSVEEARAHFEVLMRGQRKVGAQGAAVLLQEFLKGTEYVVDHVSRDGEHKTALVWKYIKGEVNGADFVYFDTTPVASDDEAAQVLIPYTRGVLDALAITNGATHAEVMLTADGPCLVEVNCRCHGGNGAWVPLASRLTGGDHMVKSCLDAYVDPDAFARLPSVPGPFQANGTWAEFVSYQSGVVTATPGYERIATLPSCLPGSVEGAYSVGDELVPSIDLFTSAGSCILVHEDPAVLAADVATIRDLELSGKMFTLDSDFDLTEKASPKTNSQRPLLGGSRELACGSQSESSTGAAAA